MKDMLKKCSAVWLLFTGFAVSTIFIVSGIGYYVISRDYQRFNTQALHLREEYIAGRRQQIKQEVEQVVAYIQYNWAKAEERLRKNLKDRTDEAFAIATNLYRVNQGRVNERETRNIILEALRPIRFNHGLGCCFATGFDGVGILFADRPELEGQSVLDTRDTRGAYVIRDMIELVRREGEGYYQYWSARPNVPGKDFPRIAYARYFAPFDGFIGAGEYLDDVEQDIQREVLERIGKIRFGKDGYVFVAGYDGVNLMNGVQPELIGKNVWDMTDPNGVKVIQEERRAVEKTEGDFIYYHWEKPSTKEISPKISFVKGFPQWRWMVGAGVYLDDIEPVVTAMETTAKNQMQKDIYRLGLALTVILAAALLICYRLSHFFKRQLDLFFHFFKEAETGGKPIAAEKIFLSEFQLLGQSANRMLVERKKAEDALRESEELYRTLVSLSPDAISMTDMNGLLTFASPRGMQMFGDSPDDEILGRSILSWVAPDEREKASANIGRLLTEGTLTATEYTLFRKDGTRFIGEVNAAVIHSPGGSPMSMIIVTRDITARKRAEEELKERERKFRAIFNQSFQFVGLITIDGRLIEINRTALLFAGVQQSDVIGKPFWETPWWTYSTELQEMLREAVKKAAAGECVRFEAIHPAADGSLHYMDFSLKPAMDEAGSVIFLIAEARDTTELKRFQDALRESEARCCLLADNATDVIWTVGMDDITRLTYVSPSVTKLLGFTVEEALARTMRQAYTPAAFEKAVQIFAEEMAIESAGYGDLTRSRMLELELVRKDGNIVPVEGNFCFLRDSTGKAIGILSMVRDITERKRGEEGKKKLEEQLFQAQKMESVGRLAGGVAHDFNNMLGVIIGRAEMALGQDVSADKLQYHLEEILKAGLRSADLTRQLLAFARKQTAVAKILHLNDTISGMLKMLRRLIGEDIDLLWAPGLDLWKVKIDPSQVDQILANLVVNARDAISGVGAITMRTENVVIDDSKSAQTPEFTPGQYVLLTVSDTGTGMTRDVCEKIFEPFFTTKELGKGTGLGLSTVYGVVKQNDGFIYVASEPGKGTTFKIYLPRFEAETAQVPSEDITGKRPAGTETILLVEDDEAILDLGKMILEELGYKVLAAHTPVYALHLVEEHPGDIHMLITDVVMPEMNGRELAEKLSAIRPNLKCLFMSGYTADVIARRGILDEGVNFIRKPFGSDDFAARVRQVLDHVE